VLLFDTAGFRFAPSDIESQGVARSRELASTADVAIVVLDGSRALNEQDAAVLEETAPCKARVLVRSKSDLEARWQSVREGLKHIAEGALRGSPLVSVSAHVGKGLGELQRAITGALTTALLEPATERPVVLRARHQVALLRAAKLLEEAAARLAHTKELEIVACDLQAAAAELDGLLGIMTPEDILDRIFGSFCIGK